MSNTSTRILKAAGLLACTSMIAIGVSMSPGAVTPAHAVECANGGAGQNPAGNDGNIKFNTACGQAAVATGATTDDGSQTGSTAIGNSADALSDGSVAVGSFTSVAADSNSGIAIGEFSSVKSGANESLAIGHNADVENGSDGAIAIGRTAKVGLNSNADSGIAIGNTITTDGQRAIGIGQQADADGQESVAIGDDADAIGDQSIAIGNATDALGTGSIAIGNGASATGSIAMGVGATAANGGTAIGDNTSATFDNSAAWGNNATTTRDNQQVFGNSDNTYTMGGITSGASKSAQGAPTHLVTSNAQGDLAAHTFDELGIATVESVDRKTSKNAEGIAIAASLADPDLVGSESFGLRMNWGGFDGENALGFTAMGVLSRDFLGTGTRLALGGGLGVGLDQSEVGGRAGGQITW